MYTLNNPIPATATAVAVKSTAHLTARNFRCAKAANDTSRSASACRCSPTLITERADSTSSGRLCPGTDPANTLNPPPRGTTGRIADMATTSATPRRTAAHAKAATASPSDLGRLDSTAASTASRPPATPHNVVAFVSARCTSTNIPAAAASSRRHPRQSAGVKLPPPSRTLFLLQPRTAVCVPPHRAGTTSVAGPTAGHHICRPRHSPLRAERARDRRGCSPCHEPGRARPYRHVLDEARCQWRVVHLDVTVKSCAFTAC